jgi:hypothetical protein
MEMKIEQKATLIGALFLIVRIVFQAKAFILKKYSND